MRCTSVVAGLLLNAVLFGGMGTNCQAGGIAGGCTPSTGPDVIVGDLVGWLKWGLAGNPIAAYAIGTTSCNIGDQPLTWIAYGNQHPVIATNAYRLKNGRFEQIGMSWVKHGWGASAENVCCTCINPQNFEALGVGCSDPYDAGTNSIQAGFTNNGHIVAGLGPRSDINPYTGAFNWPYSTYGFGGDVLYKRMQIRHTDLDPAQNAGAMYFSESQYVTPNEAAVGNHYNNCSYRQFYVTTFSSNAWTLTFTGVPATAIHRQSPAIQAWQDKDPQVTIVPADVSGDGRFYLGYKVSNNGNGTWHYEYAVWNMHSDRSGHDFSIPVPTGVTTSNPGFHDIDYHSGEPYTLTDWTLVAAQDVMKWTTQDYAVNTIANALRWGTLYNFRFDANTKPKLVNASLGLFKPGFPDLIRIASQGPSRRGDTNGDDNVNIDDIVAVITGWGACPTPPAACPGDIDGNGVTNIDDLVLVITNWG